MMQLHSLLLIASLPYSASLNYTTIKRPRSKGEPPIEICGLKNTCDCKEVAIKEDTEKKSMKCCCVGLVGPSDHVNVTVESLLIMDAPNMNAIDASYFGYYSNFTQLRELYFVGLPTLEDVDAAAFSSIPSLTQLQISKCPKLKLIRNNFLDHNRRINQRIKYIELNNNGLTEVPAFSMQRIADIKDTINLDLSGNKIRIVRKRAFTNLNLNILNLTNNELEEVADWAFFNSSIRVFDVSDTSITSLPIEDQTELMRLYAERTPNLKQFPSILSMGNLMSVKLTYPYHCCYFKHYKKVSGAGKGKRYKTAIRKKLGCLSTTVSTVDTVESEKTDWNTSFLTRFLNLVQAWFVDANTTSTSYTQELRDEMCDEDIEKHFSSVKCTPEPDALNPCEDIMMRSSMLRVLIWFVAITAIGGNLVVLSIVLVIRIYQHRTRVYNFLLANIAFSDLCVGIYLAMLAVMDAMSYGEYFNYAVEWQTGIFGCKLAGFVAMFGGQYAILNMVLLTLQIWYNTRNALYGKAFKMRSLLPWSFVSFIICLTAAVLPLVGVNSYSATSLCLPLGIHNTRDSVYLLFILISDFIAFLVICMCYVHIFYLVHNSPSPTARKTDIQLAKRMAILIGADFLCWMPNIILGSAYGVGRPLVSISTLKIFLVVFYPLNSCTNPILYVFSNEGIRNDFVNALRKIPIYGRIQTSKSIDRVRFCMRRRNPRPSVTSASSAITTSTYSTSVSATFDTDCGESRKFSSESALALLTQTPRVSVTTSTASTVYDNVHERHSYTTTKYEGSTSDEANRCLLKPKNLTVRFSVDQPIDLQEQRPTQNSYAHSTESVESGYGASITSTDKGFSLPPARDVFNV